MPPTNDPSPSTALRTDHYELTMLDAALQDGTADRPCTFETFTRALPAGRRYGVFAGLDRVVDAIMRFRFGDEELAWLTDRGIIGEPTRSWLADYRFTGDVVAYAEGELFFANSPVLCVTAPFAIGVLLETVVLSILNHDSAIASAAARMVTAADGRGMLEFGGRRTHEDAAVAAARAAAIAGFDATSNLAAGQRYGIPTAGTSAHAFTLVHDSETDAFAAQLRAAGPDTTLLVDTFDTTTGVANAIATAREIHGRLGAIRIDSGDLGAEAVAARAQLDAAGFTDTRIVVSGDLDEFRIAALRDAPIDGYGVGTSLVTGSGAPTAGFVYKLVERHDGTRWVPVAKAGGVKATRGGRKRALRTVVDGRATAEHYDNGQPALPPNTRALQVPVITDGAVDSRPSLDAVRAHHRRARAELDRAAFDLSPGCEALTVTSAMERSEHADQ